MIRPFLTFELDLLHLAVHPHLEPPHGHLRRVLHLEPNGDDVISLSELLRRDGLEPGRRSHDEHHEFGDAGVGVAPGGALVGEVSVGPVRVPGEDRVTRCTASHDIERGVDVTVSGQVVSEVEQSLERQLWVVSAEALHDHRYMDHLLDVKRSGHAAKLFQLAPDRDLGGLGHRSLPSSRGLPGRSGVTFLSRRGLAPPDLLEPSSRLLGRSTLRSEVPWRSTMSNHLKSLERQFAPRGGSMSSQVQRATRRELERTVGEAIVVRTREQARAALTGEVLEAAGALSALEGHLIQIAALGEVRYKAIVDSFVLGAASSIAPL